MLVILHHLQVPGFSGGYVGVDVFFVISGYLITSIVYREIIAGSFSMTNFYRRRIVRLAPAYFLVVFATTVFCVFALLPSELINYAESVIYSTFFMANFYMWSEAGGYFGVQADFTPLLHLWSLAVEEQFYILWPFFLFFFYKFLKFRWIAWFVVFATVISLLISEWGAQRHLAAAYYLMPTRAVELLLGACLIFLPNCNFPNIVRNVLTILGLVLVLFSVVFYTTETDFPGVHALVPCLGAMLLIYFSNINTMLWVKFYQKGLSHLLERFPILPIYGIDG
jgi:peptidoglycan/LPS O-acetylase OafA/YrhL